MNFMEENKTILKLCPLNSNSILGKSPWVGCCAHKEKLKWPWTEYPQNERMTTFWFKPEYFHCSCQRRFLFPVVPQIVRLYDPGICWAHGSSDSSFLFRNFHQDKLKIPRWKGDPGLCLYTALTPCFSFNGCKHWDLEKCSVFGPDCS